MPNAETWPILSATPLVGTLYAIFFAVGLIAVLYFINRNIRRNFKATGDDARTERYIEEGHTLHAEGIYGRRHPEEGGIPLKQEESKPASPARNLNGQPSP